jgi:hypothetical protein
LIQRIIESVMLWTLFVILAACVAAIGAFFWQRAFPPETFELRADAWTCTASHVESGTRTIFAGKVPIVQPYTTTVCDNWKRMGK